ncbi:MAG: acyl carrier protein [Colwellia sp.]|nr:acyl carrier protein [Colwellia sp.]
MENKISTIVDILSEYTSTPITEQSFQESFDTLNIDSLALVEIIFDLEEQFDISIPNESELTAKGFNFTCINDIVDLVESLVTKKAL